MKPGGLLHYVIFLYKAIRQLYHLVIYNFLLHFPQRLLVIYKKNTDIHKPYRRTLDKVNKRWISQKVCTKVRFWTDKILIQIHFFFGLAENINLPKIVGAHFVYKRYTMFNKDSVSENVNFNQRKHHKILNLHSKHLKK